MSSIRCLTGTTRRSPTASTTPSSPPVTWQRWPPPASTQWCTASSTATSRRSWRPRCSDASAATAPPRATRASLSPPWAARVWQKPLRSTGWDRSASSQPGLRSARQYLWKQFQATLRSGENSSVTSDWQVNGPCVGGCRAGVYQKSGFKSKTLYFSSVALLPEFQKCFFSWVECSETGKNDVEMRSIKRLGH